MPEKSGEDFAKEVKSKTKYKNIPIIVVTAFGGIAYSERVQQLGLSGFIPKPIRFKDFIID